MAVVSTEVDTLTRKKQQNAIFEDFSHAPTLLQLKSDEVYHIGKAPPGCHDPSTNSLISAIPGDSWLVGDFTHADGSRYAMVVNKDLAKSRPVSAQFRRPPKSLKHVSPYSGSEITFEGEYVWLAPGQGVLLKLEK